MPVLLHIILFNFHYITYSLSRKIWFSSFSMNIIIAIKFRTLNNSKNIKELSCQSLMKTINACSYNNVSQFDDYWNSKVFRSYKFSSLIHIGTVYVSSFKYEYNWLHNCISLWKSAQQFQINMLNSRYKQYCSFKILSRQLKLKRVFLCYEIIWETHECKF